MTELRKLVLIFKFSLSTTSERPGQERSVDSAGLSHSALFCFLTFSLVARLTSGDLSQETSTLHITVFLNDHHFVFFIQQYNSPSRERVKRKFHVHLKKFCGINLLKHKDDIAVIPGRFCRSRGSGTWAGCSRYWAGTGPTAFLNSKVFVNKSRTNCIFHSAQIFHSDAEVYQKSLQFLGNSSSFFYLLAENKPFLQNPFLPDTLQVSFKNKK